MKLQLYKMENCPHCEAVVIPEGINIEIIDIDKGYDGFRPDSIPVLQYGRTHLPGPDLINSTLQLVKLAKDGEI